LKYKILFIIILLLSVLQLNAQKTEREYSIIVNCAMNGVGEVSVKSGRVDVLTKEYAIEIDFARKWKESIGQALWYSLQTNRKPGIVLILKSQSDWKYLQQLHSAIAHGGMTEQFRVWAYPYDFTDSLEDCIEDFKKKKLLIPPTANYWLTLSNKRHNKSCSYFNNTKKGRFCTKKEGVACKRCKG